VEITHTRDAATGHMVQIVTPQGLREVLDTEGSDYRRPPWLSAGDEWDTESE